MVKNDEKWKKDLFWFSSYSLFGVWKIVGIKPSKHRTSWKNPKRDKSFCFIFHRFWPFICCLSVVCGLIKGISQNICILCVCVKINKHLNLFVFGFHYAWYFVLPVRMECYRSSFPRVLMFIPRPANVSHEYLWIHRCRKSMMHELLSRLVHSCIIYI